MAVKNQTDPELARLVPDPAVASLEQVFTDWYGWAAEYARAAGIDLGSPRHGRYRCAASEGALYWQDQPLFSNVTAPDAFLAQAEMCVTTRWIDFLMDEYFVCHATTLARKGQAVMLAGASGAGKSTLALALVARGFRFVGDEFTIVLPETSEALPFPKALGVKRTGIVALESLGRHFQVLPFPENHPSIDHRAYCCIPRRRLVPPPGKRIPIRAAIYLDGQSGPRALTKAPQWEAARLLYESSWEVSQWSFRGAAALARNVTLYRMTRFEPERMALEIENLPYVQTQRKQRPFEEADCQ